MPVVANAAVRDAHVEAELVSETIAVQPGQTLTVGLSMKMDPHWHTYWKNPGDSGMETRIEWQLPEGFEAGPIQWPAPEVWRQSGMVTYVYKKHVVLLTAIQVPDGIDQEKVTITARADWLACKEACIPGRADLQLTLPVSRDKPIAHPEHEPMIRKWRKKLPRTIDAESIRVSRDEDRLQLQLTGYPDATDATFFPAETGLIRHAGAQEVSADNKALTLRVPLDPYGTRPIEMVSGVLRVAEPDGPVYLAFKKPIELE